MEKERRDFRKVIGKARRNRGQPKYSKEDYEDAGKTPMTPPGEHELRTAEALFPVKRPKLKLFKE